jgi:hypothetical protein
MNNFNESDKVIIDNSIALDNNILYLVLLVVKMAVK